MQMDEDMDAEGEDQLIDDDGLVPAPRPSSAPSSSINHGSTPPADSRMNLNARRRIGPLGNQTAVDKSARKREQREREKEQQKMLLAKLIEIFEAGGGTCAVQQGQKKFPWVDLPAALIRIGCYFAGWPEKCLPKMSDKHPDRIDASTGPSQWSLKQKRAMEAQIAKGAVKVLPRPENRAVIFEVVDDFGNVKDSTVEFSENWVRNKLLGHAVLANASPAPHHALPHPSYVPESRHMSSAMNTDFDYSPQNHTLALPPIRSNVDYNERLDLPSLSKSLSGLHTPEDGSRSPSPMSNFSDGRYYPGSLPPSIRQSYSLPGRTGYPSTSQDDLFPTRGRVLTLEHGLPRTATSLRSTSRPRTNHTLHHHPYSQAMASSSVSSIRSRPPTPPSVNSHSHSHSRSHSGVGPTPLITSEFALRGGAQEKTTPLSNGASPSLASAGGQQRFPSHVPNVPSSIVAWDAHSRGWVLKVQSDSGFRTLPCQGGGLVCWHRDLDEWECRSSQQEIGKAIWNRHIGRWEFLLPSEEDVDAFLSTPHLARHAVFPTHFPSFEGVCAYDSEHLHAWVYAPSPEAESQLPISPCTIVWSVSRKQWSLLPRTPQDADITWSYEDQSWHFNMQTSGGSGYLKSSRDGSPRPSSAPHHNTLPPMIIPPTSPIQAIQSPRSAVRPTSASSSF